MKEHDPEVCGILPENDCDGCKADTERKQREFYERDEDSKRRQRNRLKAARFAQETGLTLAELAELLLPELAEGITKIIDTVLAERNPT